MKEVPLPEAGTPPGCFLAARESRNRRDLAFDRVGPLPLFDLFRRDGQPHPLANRSREEAPDRVSLPSGGLHQFAQGGTLRAFQQIQNFGGFTALTGAIGRFCRLGGLWLFGPLLGLTGLSSGLGFRRRNPGLAWRGVGLCGGFRLSRRVRWGGLEGKSCGIRCCHNFSFRGSNRGHHIDRSVARNKQGNSASAPQGDGTAMVGLEGRR